MDELDGSGDWKKLYIWVVIDDVKYFSCGSYRRKKGLDEKKKRDGQ